MSNFNSESFLWYVLQSPPEITIDIDQWRSLGEKRALFLNEFQHVRESQLSLSSQKQIIEKYYGQKASTEVYEELLAGHLFLRLAASKNPRLESWLRETEGDVFEYFYRQLESDDKRLELLQHMLGNELHANTASKILSMLELSKEEISDYFSIKIIENGWGINFSDMSDLVARKLQFKIRSKPNNKESGPKSQENTHRFPATLLHGYIFASPRYFFGSIKKIFEKELTKEIYRLKDRVEADQEMDKVFKSFVLKLSQEIHFLSTQSHYSNVSRANYGVIFDNLEMYPPCMRYLRLKLEETGHLPHMYRVQLGIFFKHAGMDVETQLKYWYETAIDNVNITFDVFNRRAGYQIRHLYGLEGGRKDYAVPGCQTLISDYFCLFQIVNPTVLEKNLPEMFGFNPKENSSLFNEILLETQNSRPRHACSNLFKLLSRKTLFINHPMIWVHGMAEKIQKTAVKESKSNN